MKNFKIIIETQGENPVEIFNEFVDFIQFKYQDCGLVGDSTFRYEIEKQEQGA